MRKKHFVLTLALLVVAGAHSASAVPTISMAEPAEGSLVLRQPGAKLRARGAVEFDVPQPGASRTLHLQQVCASGGFGYDRSLIASAPTNSADMCPYGHVTEQNQASRSYRMSTALGEVTLDSGRPVTGELKISPLQTDAGVIGVGDVTVTVEVDFGTVSVNANPMTVTLAPDDPPKTLTWSVAVPASLNKQDITFEQVSIGLSGPGKATAVLMHNGAAFMTLPTYTASFKKAVHVSIDGGAFSGGGIVLGPDGRSWNAELPMPPEGEHTISVRSVQGSAISQPVTHAFEVWA